jgi:hypothetical protein
MPPDDPKYFKKIKLEKNVLRFYKKKIKIKVIISMLCAIDGQFFINFHHISTA